jgi:hypothetical protein
LFARVKPFETVHGVENRDVVGGEEQRRHGRRVARKARRIDSLLVPKKDGVVGGRAGKSRDKEYR